MLSKEIVTAIEAYSEQMTKIVTLVVQQGIHDKKSQLLEMLLQLATTSDKIQVEERDIPHLLRSPISFLLEVDGQKTGITFSGIPGGHEFNSLILAILQAGGTPLKLDQGIIDFVKQITVPMKFEVFVSLSCHNCPDVIQTLNQFSVLNQYIESEMIDGGLYPDLISQKNIQGVPTVFLNGELFVNGKIEPAKIIAKLISQNPEIKCNNKTENSTLPIQDVTVIGAGPAGTSAAIYAARKGLSVTIVADRIGGQVKDTMAIENLISVPKTTGPELVQSLYSHMSEYDITIKEHLQIDKIVQGNIKEIYLTSGEIITTKTIIIATGSKWRTLGIPGEQENVGRGVAYCPHCDGPFFADKDVAVIGGGNSGIEAALDLAGIVNTVTVYEFQPELKADKVLITQAVKRNNIKIITNTQTQKIISDNGKVTAIEYLDRTTGTKKFQELSGVFIQIGLVPNSAFLQDLVALTKYGEVKVNEKGETNQVGIFACGDVTTVPYKQIIIAMGEGAKAALAAFEYLLKIDSYSVSVNEVATI